ncbi:MAG: elongation factor P maturation arginine rhamnosyltransferase EarP [Venatoribacter sp.]
MQWHIFCKVVDNFGDIGVCWRLAKQLSQLNQQVTLWVDDLTSFQAIHPAALLVAEQHCGQICVRHWCEPFVPSASLEQAEVVIEAFACDLPNAVIQSMKQRTQAPIWINLEYLSAESWVEGVHCAPSPVHGLKKTFFFPGFSAKTGGLLWEPELLELADKMQNQTERAKLFNEFGLDSELATLPLHISLFAYENSQLTGLLNALNQHHSPVHLLVPQGRISQQLEQWQQHNSPKQLRISNLPFMPQEQYDGLLATCQLNFVRGEESFVRAQMLGLPLIWHIYQQQEDAHLVKLDAFLQRYRQAMPVALAERVTEAFNAWNQPTPAAFNWQALLGSLDNWANQAKAWQNQLKNLGSLSANLVLYAQNTL